jgi:hypothetical protein
MKAGDENEVLDPKVITADHFSGNAKASILIEWCNWLQLPAPPGCDRIYDSRSSEGHVVNLKAFCISMNTILQASFYAVWHDLEVCSLPVGIKSLMNPSPSAEICTRWQ